MEKWSSGRSCQQLVAAADTTTFLKGQGNKLADSTFMSCGSLLVVVLDMAWRAKILVKLQKIDPFHAVKEIFTNISCMSSFVVKCGIGTCFGHKGPQNLKILRIYQTGSLTRDIIHYTKCAKIQQILVRPEYIQCFIAWLEERSVIEVR